MILYTFKIIAGGTLVYKETKNKKIISWDYAKLQLVNNVFGLCKGGKLVLKYLEFVNEQNIERNQGLQLRCQNYSE